MNRYQRLTRNTVIYFIGSTGSKIVSFLMVRYYTGVLTTSEYGIVDLIIATASFLMPMITLGINEGVFRFSMDKEGDRSKVLSSGLLIAFIGNMFLLLIIGSIHLDSEIWAYRAFAWLICFTSSINTILASYCRGIERSKLYAMSGVAQSVIQIVASIILISAMHLKMEGYIYATAIANSLTAVIIAVGIRKDVRFRLKIDKVLSKRMLIYSAPLIANSICWWVMSSIDKYVILAKLTTADNGMYSAAGKVPALITMVGSIFFQAWQLSSVAESKSADKEEFYNKIFHMLHIVLVLVSMALLILIRPIYSILVGEAFAGSWQYTPFLIMSLIFSFFASFLGTNYIAMKKTSGALYTSAIAAVVNTVLNIFLIQKWGLSGTAFATMLSYIVLFVLRMLHTAKYVKIHIRYLKFLPTYLLLLGQAFIIASGRSLYWVQAILIALVIWMNFKDIIQIIKKTIYQLKPSR